MVGEISHSQVDASSRLLLRGRTQNQEIYDESNRYIVRPKSESKDYVERLEPARRPKQVDPSKTKNPQTSVVKKDKETQPVIEKKDQEEKKQVEELDKDLTVRMRDTLFGGSTEDISEFRSKLKPNDIRLNYFEVDIFPTYFYQESTSRYWFRSHHSSGTAIGVNLRVWFTPFFGLSTSYLSTLNSELRANPEGSEYFKVDHENLGFSFKFRNFFGLTKKSKSLTFGIGYDEYNFEVPADALQRYNTSSKGVHLRLEAALPDSSYTKWVWGVELMPSLKHEEEGTAVDVQSGTDNDASSVGIWFGKRFYFNRRNQAYWKVYHRAEKVLFDGEADTVDPIDGSLPEGVNVTTGTTMFQLGFTWGR